MYSVRCQLLLLVALMLTTGCGDPRLCPVKGKVVFPDGRPLAGGTVTFESLSVTPAISAQGNIQPDGTFVLGTYKEGDGAVEGRHRAIVEPPLPTNLRTPGPPIINKRFRSYKTSGLEFTVSSDKEKNDFTIQVTSP